MSYRILGLTRLYIFQTSLLSLIIFFLLSCSGNNLFAQGTVTDTTIHTRNTSSEKDILDVIRQITKRNIKTAIDTSTKKSLGPFYSPILYPGYALVTGFQAVFTFNISFYTSRRDDRQLSSLLFNELYTQYNQFISLANTNIWTNKQKYNLVGDWRFYKFPTYTYGLGSETYPDKKTAINYSQFRFYEVVMRKIARHLNVGVGWNYDYHWDITEKKDSVNGTDDFDKYGFTNKSTSSGVTVNLQYDSRLNSNNAKNGTFASLQVRDNLKELGSTNNWQSLLLDARHYFRISKKSGNTLAIWSYNWFALGGAPPYLDLPSTGADAYNNTARGYVQNRFRGLNLVYMEAEYRFRITKNDFIGGVLFSNASSVTEYPSNKFEKINPGEGFGIRIKFNKRSDSNLCADYGFGTGGSRGFSFNLSEVF